MHGAVQTAAATLETGQSNLLAALATSVLLLFGILVVFLVLVILLVGRGGCLCGSVWTSRRCDGFAVDFDSSGDFFGYFLFDIVVWLL